MELWSRFSQAFWEEAEGPPPGPSDRAARAGTGAPAFLRRGVRFTAIGFSAMLLTAQVAGIRLAAPVDAQPSYCIVQSQECKKRCPPTGTAHAQCVRQCNEQRRDCQIAQS